MPGISIGGGKITVPLPETNVVFRYDTDTHTITLDGAYVALVEDGKVLLGQNEPNAKQELVILRPEWHVD